MRLLLSRLLLCVIPLLTGCFIVTEGGTRRIEIRTQRTVAVRVVNNCAPLLDVEGDRGRLLTGLQFGQARTVFLQAPFLAGGDNVTLHIIVQGWAGNRYLGSAQQPYSIGPYYGSRSEVFIVEYLSLPNGRGGCGQ